MQGRWVLFVSDRLKKSNQDFIMLFLGFIDIYRHGVFMDLVICKFVNYVVTC